MRYPDGQPTQQELSGLRAHAGGRMTHTPKRPGDLNQLAKVLLSDDNVDLPDAPLREGGCNPATKKPPAVCRGFFNVSKDASRTHGNASRHSGLNTRLAGVVCAMLLSTKSFLKGGHVDGDHVCR